MMFSKRQNLWFAGIVFLCFAISSARGQCTASFSCRDCAEWCGSYEHLCSSLSIVRDNCKKTCNMCATNEKCVELKCQHRCLLENVNASYVEASCQCFPGYTTSDGGRTCDDINECELPVNPCSETGLTHCKNTDGDYICTSCKAADVSRIWGYYNREECCKRDRSSRCGKSTTNGRVVDGIDARVKRWPWTAYISAVDSICGGTLIDDTHVLTAAHCLDGLTSIEQLQVTLGLSDTTLGGSAHIQEFDVQQIFIHPEYSFPNVDAAILKLNRPIAYGVYVTPVCLPGGHQPATGELCYITGFGSTSFFGASAAVLQEGNVPITDDTLCKEAYATAEYQVNSTFHLCAGREEGGQDACQGDSGGPLVCQRCNSCDWYIAGITSFGRDCGISGSYGVYTRLSYIEEWVTNITGLPFVQDACAKIVWDDWSNWEECSNTCGSATRTRKRRCVNGESGDPGCTGQNTQAQQCNLPSCARWSGYTVGECSRSCGVGTRVNTRSCIGGNVGDDGCLGEESVEENCNTFCCPYFGDYTEWSECSSRCGNGQRVRTRECNVCQDEAEGDCEGPNLEIEECIKKECAFWGPYGQYEECTVTCGTGRQSATRRCIGGNPGDIGCIGLSRKTQACNTGACDEWSTWGPCSSTCGGGKQRRQRGAQRQTRTCMEQACPVFSEYTSYGTCSRSCGGGTQYATRTCQNGEVGEIGCVGLTRIARDCNTHTCNFFGPWVTGVCSKTCGGGRQIDTRQCMGGIVEGEGCSGPSTRTSTCNTDLCPVWTSYSAYDACSVTCGGGIQTSNRQCLNGNVGEIGCEGDAVRVRDCSIEACPVYTKWTPFSDCDASCDGGIKVRTRSCPQPGLCPPDEYGDVIEETEECNIEQCPGVWNDWRDIGECTVSCGVGTQTQGRTCEGGVAGGPGCEGSGLRMIECNFPACWGEYSDFGECSASCGGGTQSRTRSCIGGGVGTGNCIGDVEDTQQCNTDICSTGVCGSLTNLISSATCCSYSFLGYCSTYSAYMATNCPLACCEYDRSLSCTGQASCIDSYGANYCTTFSGFCLSPDVRFGCQRTCGAC